MIRHVVDNLMSLGTTAIRKFNFLSGARRYSSKTMSSEDIGKMLEEDSYWLQPEVAISGKCRHATLENLTFDNLVLRTLPIDSEEENFVRQVKGACFSNVYPTHVTKPVTVAVSQPAMSLLDLGEEETSREEFAKYFSGNKPLPGSQTAAHCYCGHQFGYFSGQLGDGAAMYLGEVINNASERWEIQLKGAGLTPFSRHADGRKVLRSTIREFLCSEAMHHLGIPTTRAGCCITSDSTVIRDIFYNGNQIKERCTLVLRIAQTFIRFGSFEICKPIDMETGRQGPSVGRQDILQLMLQYVIKTFYPQIWRTHKDDKAKAYIEFYKEIVDRTAKLVSEWQCVGFCHGVLNTDNMSIVGLTIDYGPYGFMDAFDPSFICNASDDSGRYAYEKQPEICKWNCLKLAEAISSFVPMDQMKEVLETYDDTYEKYYLSKMRKKLGLVEITEPSDKELIEGLLSTMAETGADFTNSFRCLSQLPLPSMPEFKDRLQEVTEHLLTQCCTLEQLKKTNAPKMDPRQLNTMIMLMQMNPDLLAQMGGGHRGISQELERIEKTKALKEMTQEQKGSKDRELWDAWLQKYTERLKAEETSADLQLLNDKRVKVMNSVNPRFVLRNYIAQQAIDKAESGDFTEVHRVLSLLQQPYSDSVVLDGLQGGIQAMSVTKDEDRGATSQEASSKSDGAESRDHVTMNYAAKPPSWATDLRVT